MNEPLQPSHFDTLITIVFQNNSPVPSVEAWVCTSVAVADRCVAQLEALGHIEVLAVTDAKVKRDV